MGRRFQEADWRFRERSEGFDKKLGNRLGKFVEGFIKPSVVRLVRKREIAVHVA